MKLSLKARREDLINCQTLINVSGFLKNKFILFIYFWLHWVFVAVRGLSLVAASRGLLFVAVRRLLIAVASLVVEHRL